MRGNRGGKERDERVRRLRAIVAVEYKMCICIYYIMYVCVYKYTLEKIRESGIGGEVENIIRWKKKKKW